MELRGKGIEKWILKNCYDHNLIFGRDIQRKFIMKMKSLTLLVLTVLSGSALAETKEGVYIGTDVGISKGKTTGDIKIGYDLGGIRAELSQGKYTKQNYAYSEKTSIFKDKAGGIRDEGKKSYDDRVVLNKTAQENNNMAKNAAGAARDDNMSALNRAEAAKKEHQKAQDRFDAKVNEKNGLTAQDKALDYVRDVAVKNREEKWNNEITLYREKDAAYKKYDAAYKAEKAHNAKREEYRKALANAKNDMERARLNALIEDESNKAAEARSEKNKWDWEHSKLKKPYNDAVAATREAKKAENNAIKASNDVKEKIKAVDNAIKAAEDALSDSKSNAADKARLVEEAKKALEEANATAEQQGKFADNAREAAEQAKDAWDKAEKNIKLAAAAADVKYKVDSDVTMANVYYDFHNDTKFTPYIMGGLGLAHNTVTAQLPGYNAADVSQSKTSLAWQIGTGVGYSITENLTADVGVKYSDRGCLTLNKSMDVTDVGKLDLNRKIKLTSTDFTVGIRYLF